MIISTLYIHTSILRRIDSSSVKSGFSRNEVIIQLFKRAMKEYAQLFYKGSRRIKYQDTDVKNNWETKHVWYSKAEYELVQDMRKLYLMSISHILAFAVNNFLKKVIHEMIQSKLKKRNDNYDFFNYKLVGVEVENGIYWKLFWGIPPKPEHYIPKTPL